MKSRFLHSISIVVCALFLVSAGLLLASDDQEFPEEILIDNDVYSSDRKGPVPFSHLEHAEDYEIECADCHHDYEDGENVWEDGDYVNKCSECHDPDESDDEVKKLSIAFHKNCKLCHRELAKEGISEDAPYKQCTDCHEKK